MFVLGPDLSRRASRSSHGWGIAVEELTAEAGLDAVRRRRRGSESPYDVLLVDESMPALWRSSARCAARAGE